MDPSYDDSDLHNARLHVCVSCLYRHERLKYLLEIIASFAGFDVEHVDVIVCTDTDLPQMIVPLQRLLDKFTTAHFRARLTSFPLVDQRDPRELAWAHKAVQRAAYMEDANNYNHFITIEDDILFSEENFRYFCRYKDALGSHGLLPGMVRVEYNAGEVELVSVDQTSQTKRARQSEIEISDLYFASLANPYMGMYILDRALMEEYIESVSFGMESSAQRIDWGILERAVMGLTWEHAPEGSASRQVFPFKQGTHMPHPMSWIRHLPANYTNNPRSPFGKIRIDRVLTD